jgi:methionine-rich copper-binding protein CopC
MMQRGVLPAFTAAVAIMSASAVFAHARLQSSVPAADSKLGVAPKSLTLRFNEKVQLAVLKLTASGTDIPVAFDRGTPAAAELTVMLPTLPVGKYQVQWSAMSADDGHVTKGAFSFVIAGR